MANSELLDRTFAACSHPIRRSILERLAEGEQTVGEATRDFGVSKPAIRLELALRLKGAIMKTMESTSLRLERSFEASPEEVFDAWTNPELLRRWWAVGVDWSTPVAEVDLRDGGSYRLSMRDPESGAVHTVAGRYREVRRPERLVYTWAWEEGGGSGHESVVNVDFRPDGERTTVVLEHVGLASPESAAGHEHGWKACLDNLERRVLAA